MSRDLTLRFNRWQNLALRFGAGGLLVCIVAACFHLAPAVQAYWFAWIFWSGLGFGALSLLMLRFLSGGAWGDAVLRPAEAALMTLPLAAILLVPALFLLPELFSWARPGALLNAPHKHQYLTTGWFSLRAVGYFVVFIALSAIIRAYAPGDIRGISPASKKVLGNVSGPGMVVFFVCMTFASTDWVMSLETEWYSTMFAVILMISQFLSALALMIVVVTAIGGLTTKQLHDLGNLLLAFVIFWAYVSFSQFLIIWSGNLPREISWYVHRRDGGWQYVVTALALFQFAVPFALLLSRAAKQHHRRLLPIAALVVASNVINAWWLVTPTFQPDRVRLPWLEIAAFIGIGGLWCAVFFGQLKRRPPISAEIPGGTL